MRRPRWKLEPGCPLGRYFTNLGNTAIPRMVNLICKYYAAACQKQLLPVAFILPELKGSGSSKARSG